MSTRSATNKRTQERDYAGAARKSAASAKPARAAASSVRVVSSSAKARRKEYEQGESLEGLSKAEKKARKQELRAKEDRMYSAANILMKGDEEYRSKRRIFWAFEGVGIVGVIVVWLMLAGLFNSFMDANALGVAQLVGLGIAYAFVIGGFIYDLVKIRPLRNFYKAQVAGMTDRKVLEVLEEEAERLDAKKGKASKKEAAADADATASEEPAVKRGPKKNHRSRR